MNSETYSFVPIGFVRSPCKEKFGVPRQSGLVSQLSAHIEIVPPYDRDEAFAKLTAFTHIWVISVFHQALRDTWQATVRPPRLGGNKRVGVFATRAPYRPNPLGLSVFPLRRISRADGKLQLHISGCDLVDGTPVLDIKPYLPYADCISEASGGFADEVPRPMLQVVFAAQALQECQTLSAAYPDLCTLLEAILAQDPRPAYQDAVGHSYGLRIYDLNVRFSVSEQTLTVLTIERESILR